ncbi:sialate O-acetylesterase [Arcticibacter tournemirensis]
MVKQIKYFTILLWIFIPAIVKSQIKLPRLISNGMVLQRDQKVNIWGWASPGDEITISFNNHIVRTTCSEDKKWKVTLPAMKAGGPFDMIIKGKNSLVVKDILLGDVWLCSGQSNMNFELYKARELYTKEIEAAENDQIREFAVKLPSSFAKRDDVEGTWKPANPGNVLNFSAVGYFFALSLHKKHKVPVGIIHSSYSGTPAEAWISEEGLKNFPHYLEKAATFKDTAYANAAVSKDKQTTSEWFAAIEQHDKGLKGKEALWAQPFADTSGWRPIVFPGYWEDQGIDGIDGAVWVKKTVNVPASMIGQPVYLELGLIDDIDITYVNGQKVGSKDNKYLARRYEIPSHLLKEGRNTLTIRIIDKEGRGGIVPGKKYRFTNGKTSIDLSGTWYYKTGYALPELPVSRFVRMDYMPTIMYHSRIEPIIGYTIKGVAWYQGEGNSGKAIEYRSLLPALIADWRKRWGQGDFPFLIVQLANYMDPPQVPQESRWAMLRESQAKVADSIPNCGLAVAIDIGDANDLHPLNKKEVGNRLALIAQKVAYRDLKAVYPVPQYESATFNGSKVIISFKHTGSGLTAKNGALKHFAIAGEDRKFRWAEAEIKNGKVVVWSKDIAKPVAVRYAWADNPAGCNLYTKEGLPAAPFRTDKW